MKMHKTFLTAALAMSFGCLPFVGVTAHEIGDTPSHTVRYSESQLSSPAGARRLYRSLRASADAVCALEDGAGLARKRQFDSCRKAALDRALSQLGGEFITHRSPLPTRSTW